MLLSKCVPYDFCFDTITIGKTGLSSYTTRCLMSDVCHMHRANSISANGCVVHGTVSYTTVNQVNNYGDSTRGGV